MHFPENLQAFPVLDLSGRSAVLDWNRLFFVLGDVSNLSGNGSLVFCCGSIVRSRFFVADYSNSLQKLVAKKEKTR